MPFPWRPARRALREKIRFFCRFALLIVDEIGLDEAWTNPAVNVFSLIAEGGAGKSALVNEWLKRMQAENFRGAEAVLGWSFYSQGSKERATSADGFLNWALETLSIKLDTTSASPCAAPLRKHQREYVHLRGE